MATHRQIHASRLNALRSTGPRTVAGKRRSAQNALATGLFARHLVVAPLGETPEERESFRRAVLADLAPVGTVERELTDRITGLLWRLRRGAWYEVASIAATIGPLPPDPATVTGDGVDDTRRASEQLGSRARV